MPLTTQIRRDGELVPVSWGAFHIAAMAIASCLDGHGRDDVREELEEMITSLRSGARNVGEYPEHALGADADLGIPVPQGLCFQLTDYGALGVCGLDEAPILKKRYTFWDPADGEIFTLEPGDQLFAYRGSW
jgi:hypothetical protein